MSGKRSNSFAVKKAQYYVWYLGWKECRGLGGREFTEPIAKQMVSRRRTEVLPKLTIEVSKKELKIVQLVDTKKGKVEKIKYPPVQARDVTYAIQTLGADEDVVSCIYLGYNPNTQGAVHVHVYRCDSVETARLFVDHLNTLINIPEHIDRAKRIEQELAEKGQVVPRPNTSLQAANEEDLYPGPPMQDDYPPHSPRMQESPRIIPQSPRSGDEVPVFPPSKPNPNLFSGRTEDANGMYGSQGVFRQNSTSSHGTRHSAEHDYRFMDEETASQYDSLAEELKKKLGKKPLLLPPKDYDTINRARGNQFDLQNRKCKNSLILGKGKDKLESTATDSARGDSENSQDGDLDAVSPNEPSPRSLKSSGRFSGGFFDNSRDEEIEAELSGLPNNNQIAYAQPERPFSPGPNTQDLRSSYFPGDDQALPGYMPNEQVRADPYSPRGGPWPADAEQQRGGAKYTASNLGLAAPPRPQNVSRQRSHDEGYTSLERRQTHGGRDYSQQDLRNNYAGAGDYSTAPNQGRRLRRKEEYVEPPIDYTIAVKKVAPRMQARQAFH